MVIGILAYLIVLQLLFPKWNLLGKTVSALTQMFTWTIKTTFQVAVKILTEAVKLLGHMVEALFRMLSTIFSRR